MHNSALRTLVADVVQTTPIFDIHTHLYDPEFGELLVYHYLIAEGFRQFDLPSDKFWAMTKTQQADAIWQALFIDHSPVSAACRGVLAVLNALGLDVERRDRPAPRAHFAKWNVADFTTRGLDLAKVRKVCLTNSRFDDLDRPVWERGFARDPRSLRRRAGAIYRSLK